MYHFVWRTFQIYNSCFPLCQNSTNILQGLPVYHCWTILRPHLLWQASEFQQAPCCSFSTAPSPLSSRTTSPPARGDNSESTRVPDNKRSPTIHFAEGCGQLHSAFLCCIQRPWIVALKQQCTSASSSSPASQDTVYSSD